MEHPHDVDIPKSPASMPKFQGFGDFEDEEESKGGLKEDLYFTLSKMDMGKIISAEERDQAYAEP